MAKTASNYQIKNEHEQVILENRIDLSKKNSEIKFQQTSPKYLINQIRPFKRPRTNQGN